MSDHPQREGERRAGPAYSDATPGAIVPFEPDEGHVHEALTPREILSCLLRYRRSIAAIVGAFLCTGALVSALQTPHYRATARLEISAPSVKVLDDLNPFAPVGDLHAFRTAIEMIESRALAGKVVAELGLAADEGDDAQAVAVDRLLRNLDARLVANTSILAISYGDAEPHLAMRVANRMAESFIANRIDRIATSSTRAGLYLDERAAQAKRELQASERALAAYVAQSGLTPGDDRGPSGLPVTAEIERALDDAARERMDLGHWITQIESGRSASLPQVLEDPAIARLRARLSELGADYREKLTIFKPAYPQMREAAARIDGLERELAEEIASVAATIRSAFDAARSKEDELRGSLADLTARQAGFQDRRIEYALRKRALASERSQYDGLIAKRNEIAAGSGLTLPGAEIIDRAALPRDPIGSGPRLNMALSLVFGLLTSAGTIYLRETMRDGFASPVEVEGILGLPILGILPKVKPEEFPFAVENRRSDLAEAFRALRTSLLGIGGDRVPATLFVTSSIAGEGKSLVSRQLAEGFAALGARVLLIDADLRRPSLHEKFGTGNEAGLSDLVADSLSRHDLRHVIRPTGHPNLKFMTAGTEPASPADLLESPRLGQLIAFLSARFDILVVDGPPVAGLADAPILARLAAATLFVVSAETVSRSAASACVRRLDLAGAPVLGVAYNKFEPLGFEDRSAYGVSAGNPYGDERARGRVRPLDANPSASGGRVSETVLEPGPEDLGVVPEDRSFAWRTDRTRGWLAWFRSSPPHRHDGASAHV